MASLTFNSATPANANAHVAGQAPTRANEQPIEWPDATGRDSMNHGSGRTPQTAARVVLAPTQQGGVMIPNEVRATSLAALNVDMATIDGWATSGSTVRSTLTVGTQAFTNMQVESVVWGPLETFGQDSDGNSTTYGKTFQLVATQY